MSGLCLYAVIVDLKTTVRELYSRDLRKADGKDAEMSLKTRVDCEGAGSWVHGGNVLDVLHVLEGLFLAVVPVFVVQMLFYRERKRERRS